MHVAGQPAEKAVRLGPGLDFSARRWRSAVCGELRRPRTRDDLAQGAHARVVVALQRFHLLVDAGRAAQLRGERHDLKPAQHAVDTRDVATRVDLLSP